jgi:hypothetical protein
MDASEAATLHEYEPEKIMNLIRHLLAETFNPATTAKYTACSFECHGGDLAGQPCSFYAPSQTGYLSPYSP